jgi:hypothetical protein
MEMKEMKEILTWIEGFCMAFKSGQPHIRAF